MKPLILALTVLALTACGGEPHLETPVDAAGVYIISEAEDRGPAYTCLVPEKLDAGISD